jgi:Tol biopolymer transport system component
MSYVKSTLRLAALGVIGGSFAQPALSIELITATPGDPRNDGRSVLGEGFNSTVISADGRFVAFHSNAPGLAQGPHEGGGYLVFIHDRQLGTTERASVDSAEVPLFSNSFLGSISPNGRFVAFINEGGPSFRDLVFLRDRQLGTTERVDLNSAGSPANADGGRPSVSADGRYVAFQSGATNLAADDLNGEWDIFVRDRQAETTERISVGSAEAGGNSDSQRPSISADGRYVVFWSRASNFLGPDGDLNNAADIFLRDRHLGTTELISGAGVSEGANGVSNDPEVTPDGRYVVFTSEASNLVPNDTNDRNDIFVRDRVAGTTERISVDGMSGDADDHSNLPSISADGRFVSFASSASDLVPGDTNGQQDVFVRDRVAGVTRRVNLNGAGAQTTDWDSDLNSISGDGRFIAFQSTASLVTGQGVGPDVFLTSRPEVGPQFVAAHLNGNNRDDLVGDFRPRGVWVLTDGATDWVRLHPSNPGGFAVGDFDATGRDDLAIDWESAGLWIRYNGATWTNLHPGNFENLAAANFDANIRSDLLADRGANGLWVRYNNTTWRLLNSGNVEGLATGDLDGNGRAEPIGDFGPDGIWAHLNNTTWTRLVSLNPENLKTGDLDGNNRDEVIGDFGSTGLFARYNNTNTWTRLHSKNPEGLAVGDFDGNGRDDLAVDFGADGLWVRLNNATWTLIHIGNVEELSTGDFDGNGKVDLVVDFGSPPLYVRYNNATWVLLPDLPPV